MQDINFSEIEHSAVIIVKALVRWLLGRELPAPSPPPSAPASGDSPELDRVLSRKEVAVQLGISESTLYKLEQEDALLRIKIAGKLKHVQSEVSRYIAQQKAAAKARAAAGLTTPPE